MSAPGAFLTRAVRWYQRALSPRKPAPTCRFTPSCSEYAARALEQHGALKGSWLAAWRIVRCNPLVPGGFDPVPEYFPAHRSRSGGSVRPTTEDDRTQP
ncbi:membrane protein insertion efficiency factor YidD [Deinococcus reticulitermitis]|uniref:membrane protein insertion efficiency factor YidD n=1 Tax=Deinococcus reticulitermitis TaxID=856736 RepID=UPI000ADBD8B3